VPADKACTDLASKTAQSLLDRSGVFRPHRQDLSDGVEPADRGDFLHRGSIQFDLERALDQRLDSPGAQ
jgi:hypothetical protein